MRIPLRLGLHHTTSADGEQFNLTIEDIGSGVQFVDVTITPDAFADLVTGTPVRVDGDVRPQRLGMVSESREVVVRVTDLAFKVYQRDGESRAAAEAAVNAAAARLDAETPCEGATPWRGDADALYNAHKSVGAGNGSRVIFGRFVPRPS